MHNVGERLDFEALPGERPPSARTGKPSLLVRAGGHTLLWTMVAVVCYSAAL